MTTITRKFALTLSGCVMLVALVALPATAQPSALLIAPEPDDCLPEFGFASFNIGGVGERVTSVRWGGLASRLGLEPGDLIFRMNGYRLSYHGAWNDALRAAMNDGGWVQLTIRDVRTGRLAFRETFVGDGHVVGPITPKIHVGGYRPPVVHRHDNGYPSGPITPKSLPGDNRGRDVNETIKRIANLFD
jgi:hypothetical protein